MLLISNDQFFVSGVRELIAERIFYSSCDLMILDASPFIYVFDSYWFFSQGFKEPFSALIICNDFLYIKGIDVGGFINAVNDNRKEAMSIPKSITVSEIKVLRYIFNGYKDKDIAKQFNCSKKTISSHKIKALNKMRIKNTRVFYTLVNFWKTSWPIPGHADGKVRFYYNDEGL
ncbi:hypothetical protein RS279_002150 [Salmonella enterica]|nr:hypothetical protein [Salmonella enterica]